MFFNALSVCLLFSKIMLIIYGMTSVSVLGRTQAASLPLAKSPMFAALLSRANIMIALDDGASMDSEVLTSSHWNASAYQTSEGLYNDDGLMYAKDREAAIRSFPYIHAMSDNIWAPSEGGLSVFEEAQYLYQGNKVNSKPSDLNVLFNGIVDWRFFSSPHNLLYYNPKIIYEPWPNHPEAIFDHIADGTKDISLDQSLYIVAQDTRGAVLNTNFVKLTALSPLANPDGHIDLWDDHQVYRFEANAIQSYRAEISTVNTNHITYQPDVIVRDPIQVSLAKTNYANWFQYHRKRHLALKSALVQLIKKFPHYRYFLSKLSVNGAVLMKPPIVNSESPVSAWSAYQDELIAAILSTPLQRNLDASWHVTMNTIGEYFKTHDDLAPIINSSQNNYLLLITDGIIGSGLTSVQDDVAKDPTPTPTQSLAEIAKQDDVANDPTPTPTQSLAEIAKSFYTTDLRADLDNHVKLPGGISTHQHLKTIVMGLELPIILRKNPWGLPINDQGELLTINSPDWSNAAVNARIQYAHDLLYATFSSGGAYFSITDDFFEAFNQFVDLVEKENSSMGTSLVMDAAHAKEKAFLYKCQFNPLYWSGDVIAYDVDYSTGNVNETPIWTASQLLNAQHHIDRNILCSYPNDNNKFDTVGFFRSSLPTVWKNMLLSKQHTFANDDAYVDAMVNFLRGDDQYGDNNTFRRRAGKLGDIIYAKPVAVAEPLESSSLYQMTSYLNFKRTYHNRPPILYVGANDGMLHAFHARTGEEFFAYIPYQVGPYLTKLASPLYAHYPFFDSTPMIKDVLADFENSGVKSWKTILVTGFGSGIKGLLALDITDPDAIKNGASNPCLWEFSASDKQNIQPEDRKKSENMGHQLQAPTIGMMMNDQWAVIIGNGYNSIENQGSDGQARLFVLDIATGEPIKTIIVPGGTPRNPNGLCTPMAVGNRLGRVQNIYAADILGNIWKFDCNSSNINNWRIAHQHNGVAIPFFAGNPEQPITAELNITPSQDGLSYLIVFGTGRYLLPSERYSTFQTTQKLCVVRDSLLNQSVGYNDLLVRHNSPSEDIFLASGDPGAPTLSSESRIIRRVSATNNDAMDWSQYPGWRLELLHARTSPPYGERVLLQPSVRKEKLSFITFSPYGDNTPAIGGGYGWIIELNTYTGLERDEVVLDINSDGLFNELDYSKVTQNQHNNPHIESYVPGEKPSSIVFNGFILSTVDLNSNTQTKQFLNTTKGLTYQVNKNLDLDLVDYGRQAWKQIK